MSCELDLQWEWKSKRRFDRERTRRTQGKEIGAKEGGDEIWGFGGVLGSTDSCLDSESVGCKDSSTAGIEVVWGSIDSHYPSCSEGDPSGAMVPAHFIVQKESSKQKVGAGRKGETLYQAPEDNAKKPIFPSDRLSGTRRRKSAWVPDVSVYMCATAVPSGAQDRSSAFDHVKESDSLPNTG